VCSPADKRGRVRVLIGAGAAAYPVVPMDDPDVDQAAALIEERMGSVLALCSRVRKFALAITQPWGGRTLGVDAVSDTLIVALFTRSYGTFCAAVELARLGFGAQAAMLNRSLFEDMVDAHWIATEPIRAEALMRDHDAHGRMLLADAVAKHPSLFSEVELPQFDADERKRLDTLFGKYGTRSWTTLNLHDRIDQIEHRWRGNDDDLEVLRFYRDIAQRENNQTLHVSARGLGDTLRGRDETGIVVAMGPGLEMIDRALFGSFWIYSQTVGLLLDHFDFDIDDETRTQVFFADAAFAEAGSHAPNP
jgi:hypothetical protein